MNEYYLMPHPPVMISEIGKGRETEINNTIDACKKIGEKIEKEEVETVVIITPHGPIFRDGVAIFTSDDIKGDFGKFGAPEVDFNYNIDKDLSFKIIDNAKEMDIVTVSLDEISSKRYNINLELDHGAMVPLYYVGGQEKYKLVHITYGMISPIELLKFGTCIKKAIEESDKSVVVIASGDLSHRLIKNGPYPYSPLGKTFDLELIKTLRIGEAKKIFSFDKNLIKEAGECGLRSLYILSGVINSEKIKGELLSYEGPFGVGYGVMKFEREEGDLLRAILQEKELEHKRRINEGNPYTRLARRNLDAYYYSGTLLSEEDIKDMELLKDKKGVFVSLKINGDLRGCIGTIEGTTSCVGEEIIKNSISAALNDHRFNPVKKEELLEIDISVDLLYPREKATFEELNPKEYGVIVSWKGRRGLLLPMLEGVNTKEEQIKIALEKGGIPEDAEYEIERFKVERFKEVKTNE